MLMRRGALTNSNKYIHSDVDCGMMWASPHLLLASHQCHCDGTTDGYDIPDIHGWNYCLMDDFFSLYICILFMVPGMAMFCIDCSPIFLCR